MSGRGVVVLAAGRGTRMKSALPKVLHPVCGLPLVAHVVEAARSLDPARIAVVVGYGREAVEEALAGSGVTFVNQGELLGTADAVRRCREALAGCSEVVILNGDVPLIMPETLRALATSRGEAPGAFVCAALADPGRLGRVERDAAGRVARIVEAADYRGPGGAGEINAGQYAFAASWLWPHLDRIAVSAKGEYYLTDLVAMAHAEGIPVATAAAPESEVLGVDDRVALARAEAVMRERLLQRHMLAGVTVVDPATTYVHAGVELGPESTILPNCYLYGRTRVAAGCTIGPGTTLQDATVGEGSTIQSSVIEDSAIGARVRVGPFAHIRGGATVGDDCEIGNYAEIKNSVVGRGVKMHHFAYLGDADVGERSNLAAGMITCNWDGVQKSRTTIGADVFVGCDTMLVAPVTLGDGSYTATGSVVLSGRDVPPGGRVAGVPAKPMRPKPRSED